MGDEAAVIAMGQERPEEESDVASDFEMDDAIKQDLDKLLNIHLEFEEDSSDEKEHSLQEIKTPEKVREDSIERQLEALFVEDKEPGESGNIDTAGGKDTGLENISDNEFDGPESGECDTSDGEIPDSPNIVVTLPDMPPALPPMIQGVDDVSLDGDSEVELVEEYQKRSREYYDTVSQKINVTKPDKEVIIDSRVDSENPKSKERKEKDSSKIKEKNGERGKNKDKKDKSKKKKESSDVDEDLRKKLKLKKYLARLDQYRAKCLEYMTEISKCDIIKKVGSSKIKLETSKIRTLKREDEKLKSVVEKVNKERVSSPHSSTHSSHHSRPEKVSHNSTTHGIAKRRSTSEKQRKSKPDKKVKSKSKEFKEHKIKYQKYILYLQSEREKCYKERIALDRQKNKSKRKRRKSESSSPEKSKGSKTPVCEKTTNRPPVLSFAEFCHSRELASPGKETPKKPTEIYTNGIAQGKKERAISVDSLTTTSTVVSDHVHHADDDKELFPTYSEIVEQDQIKNKTLEEDREKIEDILEKDPELKSISVFTSVLFKGSADTNGIPFLQEGRKSPSPKIETYKAKSKFSQSIDRDEIYDCCDNLLPCSKTIYSPCISPEGLIKVHNKALLNFVENQKESFEKRNGKSSLRKSSSCRSASKSPKKERSISKKQKSKHNSSGSPSPPLKVRSPDVLKKKSPPAYLKERWKDYPSPPEHRRENAARSSRTRRRSRSRSRTRLRVSHRSRSSSEERHYRRFRSRSRSRSRSPPTMVQISNAENRRKLKEDNEKAFARLRATFPKPMSTTPLSITFTTDGDNYEPIRDNYDPVVMNEDSSSPSTSEVAVSKPAEASMPAMPPLPPGLPPEPPPMPPSAPAAPAVHEGKDLTVVTTYTSYVPFPNSNIGPSQHHHHPQDMVMPMGYMNTDMNQMPPFNNWIGPNVPMGDMGTGMQHHMFRPPQMMNSYDQFHAPPQQPFSFLNQPPPPLPYQMQMPPPCHQHYRMPNQGPPPNINLISVCQEIKNIKSNPVVITQIPDSPEKDHSQTLLNANLANSPQSNNKCKHNPSGQNNETITEDIDIVKECPKNCDGVKSKDPRLAPVDMSNKSPDKSEGITTLSGNKSQTERKVKITLNYKPRPITAVEQTCIFDPESDVESEGKSTGVSESSIKLKASKYTEKNSNIEDIVSKLKDTINTSGCHSKMEDLETCETQILDKSSDSSEKKNPGDEPYDPFNASDENAEENGEPRETPSKTEGDKSNIENLSKTPPDLGHRLSATEVEVINNQIVQSFAFILSHSIDRERLTPTLTSINAKKGENESKCNLTNKPPKPCQILCAKQKKVGKIINTHKIINYSTSVVTVENNLHVKDSLYTPQQPIWEKETQAQLSFCTPRQPPQKTDMNIFHNLSKDASYKKTFESEQTKLDIVIGCTSKGHTNIGTEFVNHAQSISAKIDNTKISLDKQSSELLYIESKKNSLDDNEKNVSHPDHCKNLLARQSEHTSKEEVAFNNLEDVQIYIPDKHSKEETHIDRNQKRKLDEWKEISEGTEENGNAKDECDEMDIQKQSWSIDNNEASLELESSKIFNESKEADNELVITNNKNEIINLSAAKKASYVATNNKSFVANEQVSCDGKMGSNIEKRTHPLLSIPTKGELKRFPTPERTIPYTTDTSVVEKLNGKSNSTNNKLVTENDNIYSLTKDKTKGNVSKPFISKNVVECILHDFEDSNSMGSDFPEVIKEKDNDVHVVESNQVFITKSKNESNSALKNVSDKIVVILKENESPPHKTVILSEDEIPKEQMLNESKTSIGKANTEIPLAITKSQQHNKSCRNEVKCESVKSDDISTTNLNTKNKTPPKDSKRKVCSLDDDCIDNGEHIKLKVDSRNKHATLLKDLSKCKRRDKKGNAYDTSNYIPSESYKTDKTENEGFKLNDDISNSTSKDTVINTSENGQKNTEFQDKAPKPSIINHTLLIKPIPKKAHLKPCPLSKKSKSYISQHLPASFDLSVDGHLIRRGFKRVHVSLIKASSKSSHEEASGVQIENPPCEYITTTFNTLKNLSNDNIAKSNLNVTLVGEMGFMKKSTEIEKHGNIKKPKEKTKKKVSFNMNISEIIDSSDKFLGDDEVTSNINENSTLAYKGVEFTQPENIISAHSNDNAIFQNSYNTKSAKASAVIEEAIPDFVNIKEKDEANTKKCIETISETTSVNNSSQYYESIIKTLYSFQTMPLTQLQKRKSLILTIPKVEDMPEAKIRDSPKKMSNVKSKKKSEIVESELSDDCHIAVQPGKTDDCLVQKDVNTSGKNSETKTSDVGGSNFYETLQNNNSRSLEQNESDNDDSVILDRELSDLAKGCLDSDSTVGGDDDSVLNFGIAASDDSSVDSDFVLKWKNIPSKLSARQQNKLSSPQNIKRRFSKKLKCLGVEVGSKKAKLIDCQVQYSKEIQLFPEQGKKLSQNINNFEEENKGRQEDKFIINVSSDEASSQGTIQKCSENNLNGTLQISDPKFEKTLETVNICYQTIEVGKVQRKKRKRRFSKRKKSKYTEEEKQGDTNFEVVNHKEEVVQEGLGKLDKDVIINEISARKICKGQGTDKSISNKEYKNQILELNCNSLDKEMLVSETSPITKKRKEKEVKNETFPCHGKSVLHRNTSSGIIHSAEELEVNELCQVLEPDEHINKLQEKEMDDNLEVDLKEIDTFSVKQIEKEKNIEQETSCCSDEIQKNTSDMLDERCNHSEESKQIEICPVRKKQKGNNIIKNTLPGCEHKNKFLEVSDPDENTKTTERTEIKEIRKSIEKELSLHDGEAVSDRNIISEITHTEEEMKTRRNCKSASKQQQISSYGDEDEEQLKGIPEKNNSKEDRKVNEASRPKRTRKEKQIEKQISPYKTMIDLNDTSEPNHAREKLEIGERCIEKNTKDTSSYSDEAIEQINTISEINCCEGEVEVHEPCQVRKEFKLKQKEKREIEKLEADSSTSVDIPLKTGNLRKTRSTQQKRMTDTTSENIQNSVPIDHCESPGRKTRKRINLCEITKKVEFKQEKTTELKPMLITDYIKPDSEVKDYELDAIEPQLVCRSLSTESNDEPLILVKQKLLASKLEESRIQEETTISQKLEESKNYTKINDILQNENSQNKVKSHISDGSESTRQSKRQDIREQSDDKSPKNVGNDTNESGSISNNLPNTDPNNKSNSNTNYVSSTDITNNKTLSQPSSFTKRDINKHIFQSPVFHDVCSSMLQNTTSVNPKLKDALGKKRDKAEVDAEIKRRLAEIDELEQLARSQHDNVLEKIGARTRSRTLNEKKSIDDEDDVVSISSDEVLNTYMDANDIRVTCTVGEINKSPTDVTNEEPTSTQKDKDKTEIKACDGDVTNNENKTGVLSTTSTEIAKRTRSKKVNENDIGTVLKIGDAVSDQFHKGENDPVLSNSEKTPILIKSQTDNLASEESLNNSSEIAAILTPAAGISKKIRHSNTKKTLSIINEEMSNFSRESSSLTSISTKRVQRNTMSIYQFKETDDDSESNEDISTKHIHNRLLKKKYSLAKHRIKANASPSTVKYPSSVLPEYSFLRKTRKKSMILEVGSDKYVNSSRDSSPSYQKQKKIPCEMSCNQISGVKSKKIKIKNIVPEPDSSTSALINTICSISSNLEKSSFENTEVSPGRIESLIDEPNIIESTPTNLSQEIYMRESSPLPVFRKPYRKSLVNRKRRRRRPLLGRCLSVSTDLVTTFKESKSFKYGTQLNTQNDEVVSSSVSTIQLPSTQIKKKRRRKTVMDLLMEDSMLSVTRDFPMSPNPYMLPTFYKEIDLSNPNKINLCNQPNVTEQNSKKPIENHELPPKPDFLAQKLRLLEKLKSISRKNRKTRQCRTLVCYNEDSLPESLVESPVGESTQATSDIGILPQEVCTSKNNKNDSGQNNLTESSLPESTDVQKDYQPKSASKDDAKKIVSLTTTKRGQNPNLSKAQLKNKKVRKSKLNQKFSLSNKSIDNTLKNISEKKSNIANNDTIDDGTICYRPLAKERVLESDKHNEASDFDKLLETKSVVATTQILTFNFEPTSTLSTRDNESNDTSDVDYYDTFLSPLQSDYNSDASEYEDNIESELPSTKASNIKCDTSSDIFNSKQSVLLQPKKIVCSILKAKIGKMLPYFDNTSSEEDLDEDIPLSIKFLQSNKVDNSLHITGKDVNSSNSGGEEISHLQINKTPPVRKRGRKPRASIITSPVRKPERKFTRSSVAALIYEEDCLPAVNKENQEHKKQFHSSGSLVLSNVESSPLLRKSNRKPKTSNISYKAKANLQVDNLGTVEAALNQTPNETNNRMCGKDINLVSSNKAFPPKRRGRPSRMKLAIGENNIAEDFQKTTAQLSDSFVDKKEHSSHHEKNETSIVDVVENNHLSKRKPKNSRVLSDNDSPEITIKHTVYYEGTKNDGDNLDTIALRKSQDSPRLELSDLDLAIQKSITLRRTRAKHLTPDLKLQKNQGEIIDSVKNECENDFNNDGKLDMSFEDSPQNKKSLANNELYKKQRGRKGKLPTVNDHSVNIRGHSTEFSPQGSRGNNKNEKDLKTPLKTRGRKPKIRTLDNPYLEPPSLEILFEPEIGGTGKEDLGVPVNNVNKVDNTDQKHEKSMTMPSIRRGRKSKKTLDPSKHQKEIEHLTLQCEPVESSDRFENDSRGTDQEKIESALEERKILTKKRGRKGKRKVFRKRTRQDFNFLSKDIDSEYDSEVEITIPVIKSSAQISINENSQDRSSRSKVVSKTSMQEEAEIDLKANDTDCSNCNVSSDFLFQGESKKRRRMLQEKDEISFTEATTKNHDTTEHTVTPASNEKEVKKRKIQDENDEIRTDKTLDAPTTTNNFQETPASTSHNPINQILLWNKISGFLNKTTRSVGTQVKIKNMALKGFDTSEPEVSLQSELTLPLVIKTLFEELKSLDSSFSNP